MASKMVPKGKSVWNLDRRICWLTHFDRLADKAEKAAGAVVKDKGAVA
jgi:hypothetical protein